MKKLNTILSKLYFSLAFNIILNKKNKLVRSDDYHYRWSGTAKDAHRLALYMRKLAWRYCVYIDGDIGFDFDLDDYLSNHK